MLDKKTKCKLRRIWCERLFIGLCVSVALGFSIVKVQSVYSLANLIKEEKEAKPLVVPIQKGEIYVRTRVREDHVETELLGTDLVGRGIIRAEKDGVKRKNILLLGVVEAITNQKKQQLYLMEAQQQKLQQESLFLAISVLCFIIMLLLLLRQRNRISLTLTGQLICFFPEECIAELEALRQQLKSEHYSTSLIRVIMFRTFLELLCVFYIQNNIENLWLPQHKGRKNGDE